MHMDGGVGNHSRRFCSEISCLPLLPWGLTCGPQVSTHSLCSPNAVIMGGPIQSRGLERHTARALCNSHTSLSTQSQGWSSGKHHHSVAGCRHFSLSERDGKRDTPAGLLQCPRSSLSRQGLRGLKPILTNVNLRSTRCTPKWTVTPHTPRPTLPPW